MYNCDTCFEINETRECWCCGEYIMNVKVDGPLDMIDRLTPISGSKQNIDYKKILIESRERRKSKVPCDTFTCYCGHVFPDNWSHCPKCSMRLEVWSCSSCSMINKCMSNQIAFCSICRTFRKYDWDSRFIVKPTVNQQKWEYKPEIKIKEKTIERLCKHCDTYYVNSCKNCKTGNLSQGYNAMKYWKKKEIYYSAAIRYVLKCITKDKTCPLYRVTRSLYWDDNIFCHVAAFLYRLRSSFGYGLAHGMLKANARFIRQSPFKRNEIRRKKVKKIKMNDTPITAENIQMIKPLKNIVREFIG